MSPKASTIVSRMSIVFFCIALIYFLLSGADTVKAPDVVVATSTPSVPAPVLRVESFTYDKNFVNLTIEYPQFVQSSSSSLESLINKNFKSEAKKLYDDQLKELTQSAGFDELEGVQPREVLYERKVQKDRVYINGGTGIFSVPYTNYIDTGGAHGTFFYSAETIDIYSGKKIELTDVLQGEYEAYVLSSIQKQISVGSSTDTCVNCYAELASSENLSVFIPKTFILTANGITFLYSAYDLGAYALTSAGQEVSLTKDLLSGFIRRVW